MKIALCGLATMALAAVGPVGWALALAAATTFNIAVLQALRLG